jgi:hypothetical protein
MKLYSCLKIIPAFHPFSEALMSNLASRSFEWEFWEIQELLFRPKIESKKSKLEFCVCLTLKEKGQKKTSLYVRTTESPTGFFLKRHQSFKIKSARLQIKLKAAKVLAQRKKNSKGIFKEKNQQLILDFEAARHL